MLVAVPLAGCQTTADDIAYPDLARTPPPPTSTATLSPLERDAAIEEMRAEARANAQRGL